MNNLRKHYARGLSRLIRPTRMADLPVRDLSRISLDFPQDDVTWGSSRLKNWIGFATDTDAPIRVFNGGADAVLSTVLNILGRDRTTAVPQPGYPYPAPNPVKLEEGVIADTAIINPVHNPTGLIMKPDELDYWLSWPGRARNEYLIIDQVYSGIATDYGCISSRLSPEDNVICINSFKDYAMPGLRLGWLATKSPTILAHLDEMEDHDKLIDPIRDEIACATLQVGHRIIKEQREIIERRRQDFADNRPRSMEVVHFTPRSPYAYYRWTSTSLPRYPTGNLFGGDRDCIRISFLSTN